MKYNKLILIFVILVLACNIVNAEIRFDEVKCSKDGSLEFAVHSDSLKIDVNNIKIIAKLKTFYDLTLSKIEVNGSWNSDYIGSDASTFKSEDAQIIDAGEYEIILNYIENDLTKNIMYIKKCPGLIFSCDLLNIDIENCTNIDNKYFNLLIEISGINQSTTSQTDILEGIRYNLVAENRYKDIKGLYSDKGSLPEGIKIINIDKDLYLFSKELLDNLIFGVNVYMEAYGSECKDAKIYDYQDCSEIHTETIENNKTIGNSTTLESGTEYKTNKTLQQETSIKLTGDVIKINETKKNNSYWIYIILSIIIILTLIFIIFKKQKVNKYV